MKAKILYIIILCISIILHSCNDNDITDDKIPIEINNYLVENYPENNYIHFDILNESNTDYNIKYIVILNNNNILYFNYNYILIKIDGNGKILNFIPPIIGDDLNNELIKNDYIGEVVSVEKVEYGVKITLLDGKSLAYQIFMCKFLGFDITDQMFKYQKTIDQINTFLPNSTISNIIKSNDKNEEYYTFWLNKERIIFTYNDNNEWISIGMIEINKRLPDNVINLLPNKILDKYSYTKRKTIRKITRDKNKYTIYFQYSNEILYI